MHEIHQSVARRVMLKVYLDTDHISPATGKTVAVVISKNGGAFANPSAGATNATELANGWYYVDLSTTDTNTLGDLVVRGTESDSDPTERLFAVVAATNRGMTALPAAAADAAGGLPISDAGGLDLDAKIGALTYGTANRVNAQVYGAEAGTITATAIANNAFTAAKFASGAFDAVWSVTTRTLSAFGFAVTLHADYDAAKTAAQPGEEMDLVDAPNATAVTAIQDGLATGTAQDSAQAVLDKLDDTLEDDTGTYRFTANALEEAPTGGSAPTAGEIADAVWDEDLTGHTTDDSAGKTLGNVATGTPPTAAAIADAVWDEATTGHTTSGTFGEQLKTDVDAILADTNELQSNQGNWLTATGFSTHSAEDVVTALGTGSTLTALATQASVDDIPTVTEFNARTLVAADYFDPAADTVARVTLVDTTTTNSDMRGTDGAALASVCTEVRLASLTDWLDGGRLDLLLDAILADTTSLADTTMGEIAGASDAPADATLKQGMRLLYMWLRNNSTQTASARNVKNDAGTTVLSAAVSDDGTTFAPGKLGAP